jgi:hypothetical protein
MYNPYIQATTAKLHQDDLLREAQHAHQVALFAPKRLAWFGSFAPAQRRMRRWLADRGLTLQTVRLDEDPPISMPRGSGD